MRVTIRSRTEYPDGTSTDEEVDVSADGSYSPDVLVDLVARAYELWTWTYAEDDEAEK